MLFDFTGLTFQMRKVMGGRIILSVPVPFLRILDLGFGTGLGLDNNLFGAKNLCDTIT